jgi:hypothetical protein
LSTPVRRLSGTSRRGTPPKNANASTCASVHARWSIVSTGRAKMCREHASTMANAHTRRRLPVAGSTQ